MHAAAWSLSPTRARGVEPKAAFCRSDFRGHLRGPRWPDGHDGGPSASRHRHGQHPSVPARIRDEEVSLDGGAVGQQCSGGNVRGSGASHGSGDAEPTADGRRARAADTCWCFSSSSSPLSRPSSTTTRRSFGSRLARSRVRSRGPAPAVWAGVERRAPLSRMRCAPAAAVRTGGRTDGRTRHSRSVLLRAPPPPPPPPPSPPSRPPAWCGSRLS